MLIDARKITDEGSSFRGNLELDDKFLIDEGGYFTGDLKYDIRFIRAGDQIKARGHIKTKVSLKCVKCLENFEIKMNSVFDIILFPINLIQLKNQHLNEDEMEYIFYEGNEIDVDKILIEQINFLIPINPVCDSKCKGICPVCGADLNHEKCKCDNAINEISLVFDKIKR
jgi:uncharacterized protein